MMRTRFDFGDAVRVIRNVKDDGTYPGADVGQLLVRRGSVGHVVDIGTFLQDQVIYSVHFLDINRIVGCREEELIGGADEWVPSRYEFREKVRAALPLGKEGQVVVPGNAIGEIIKVLRNATGGVAYQVHFECLLGRVLQVPEAALLPLAPQPAEALAA
jgi:nitrogen fixation protein NifZ